MKLNNKYYILRHGEAVSNVNNVVSCWPERFKNPLTRHGQEMIMATAEMLKEKKIDVIIASPLLRTKQTAQIVAKELNLGLKFDKRLREVGFGALNHKPITEINNYFKSEKDRITRSFPRGETYQQIVARVYGFLKDINKKYKDKNILIVSHQGPLWMLENRVKGFTLAQGLKGNPEERRIDKGQVKELN